MTLPVTILAPLAIEALTKITTSTITTIRKNNTAISKAKIYGGVGIIQGLYDAVIRYKEISAKKEVDIRKLEEQSKVIISYIKSNQECFEQILKYTFAERDKMIDKSFEVIDHAIKTNNTEALNQGFGLLHRIATQDIFGVENLEKAKMLLDQRQLPTLEI